MKKRKPEERTRKRSVDEGSFDDFDEGLEPEDDGLGLEPEQKELTPTQESEGYDDGLFSEDLNDDFGEGGVAPLKKYNDLLKDLTSFAPYLKDTVNGWLGLTWNEEKQGFLPSPDIKAIMNTHCAAWCIGALKTYARSNNIITDIGREEYKNIMSDIIEYVWLNVGTRAEEFGIFNDGDILRICNELEHASALVLMGAGDGKYNTFLGTTYTHNTSGQINPGMFGGMPGIGGGYGMPQAPQKVGTLQRLKKVFLGS